MLRTGTRRTDRLRRQGTGLLPVKTQPEPEHPHAASGARGIENELATRRSFLDRDARHRLHGSVAIGRHVVQP